MKKCLKAMSICNFNIVFSKNIDTASVRRKATPTTVLPDSSQWDYFDNLSHANASEKGEAVYWARGVRKSYQEDAYSSLRIAKDYEYNSKPSNLQFSLYPTPASNSIIISASDKTVNGIECFIYDLAGKELIRSSCLLNENKNEVNVSSLVNGNYLIKISSSSSNSYYNKLLIIK